MNNDTNTATTESLATTLPDLAFSDEFQAIVRLRDRFDLFQALGIAHRELPHSNLLAYFLDPGQPHGCGDGLMHRFVHHVLVELRRQGQFAAQFGAALMGAQLKDAHVHREWNCLDLLIELRGARIVIGIENKIWSGEGDQQLARYQRTLSERYPGWVKVMVFLTPRGSLPTTQDEASGVPCVPMSWASVGAWLRDLASDDNGDAVQLFLELTAQHLEANVTGMSEEKELIQRIWGNRTYATTLLRLYEERPRLGSTYDKWVSRVEQYLGEHGLTILEAARYPTTGYPNEIKIKIGGWEAFPITFMLYYDTRFGFWPALRTFVHVDDYAAAERSFARLAEAGGDAVDPQYPQMPGWSWRRVFLGEPDYPPQAEIQSLAFDEVFVKEAFERFRAAFETLAPIVAAASKEP